MKFKMVHENYNVKDLDASLKFYEEALGLTERRRKVSEDGSFIIVYVGNETTPFELELTWLKDHPQAYDIGEEEFHLAFHVDDYEGAHALHEKMGCYLVLKILQWASILSRIQMDTGLKSYLKNSLGNACCISFFL